jgi:transposase-like protein
MRSTPQRVIDAIVVKIRDGQVANRPIYAAISTEMQENGGCDRLRWPR